jgi:hypothetical protein
MNFIVRPLQIAVWIVTCVDNRVLRYLSFPVTLLAFMFWQIVNHQMAKTPHRCLWELLIYSRVVATVAWRDEKQGVTRRQAYFRKVILARVICAYLRRWLDRINAGSLTFR